MVCHSVVQFLVIISFIKLILLKIRVKNVKYQIYEWQRATSSDAFHYFYEQDAQRSPSHLRGVWTKRATASGALPFVYLKI
jgi:hypothetical protein